MLPAVAIVVTIILRSACCLKGYWTLTFLRAANLCQQCFKIYMAPFERMLDILLIAPGTCEWWFNKQSPGIPRASLSPSPGRFDSKGGNDFARPNPFGAMGSKSSQTPPPPPPPPPILCASFNQDNSCFAIATRDGVRVFDARTGRLFYERYMGAFSIVEMLFSSSLLAIVGAGEQPSLSPRRLCLFDTVTEATRRELNFLTSILAVRLNRKRLIVILQDKTYIYDLNSVAILDTIDTVPNPKGLCAFSPSSDACYLALPASKTKGSVLIYNTMELVSLCQIDAHQRPLAAIAFSSSGMYLATASEQGTIIRVHLVSQATKSYSFRRGTYPSTIYSISFGPSMELPDVLVTTSSSGSVHIFSLESMVNQSKPASKLGSMIPGSINGALESADHHVLHNAAPQGMKSYAIIHSADKIGSTMQMSTYAIRLSLFLIDQGGHFREYILNISQTKGLTWRLERQVNLLDTSLSTLR